jgi:hypothetical protein
MVLNLSQCHALLADIAVISFLQMGRFGCEFRSARYRWRLHVENLLRFQDPSNAGELAIDFRNS